MIKLLLAAALGALFADRLRRRRQLRPPPQSDDAALDLDGRPAPAVRKSDDPG